MITGDLNRREPAVSLGEYGARMLSRRRKKLVQVEDDLGDLEPPALHKIRLSAKRLRYAAEISLRCIPARQRIASSAGWAGCRTGSAH